MSVYEKLLQERNQKEAARLADEQTKRKQDLADLSRLVCKALRAEDSTDQMDRLYFLADYPDGSATSDMIARLNGRAYIEDLEHLDFAIRLKVPETQNAPIEAEIEAARALDEKLQQESAAATEALQTLKIKASIAEDAARELKKLRDSNPEYSEIFFA